LELERSGSKFVSETDTEVGAHLLNFYLNKGLEPLAALRDTCARIRGSYAFLAIDAQHPDRILVAKNSTPIVIGVCADELFIASDIPALLEHTRSVIILEDGDIAEVRASGVRIEHQGVEIKRPVQQITWDAVTAQKGGYKHFMLKEIFEQGRVVADTLRSRIHANGCEVSELGLSPDELRGIKRISIVACGTAWHAGLVTKFFVEQFARVPVEVDYASEFRYRDPVLEAGTLVLAISQSGETADTLAAVELAMRETRGHVGAICNVIGSSLARKVGRTIFTHAGPEISVASTKAFTTQVTAGLLLAIALGAAKGSLSQETVATLLGDLAKLPAAIDAALGCAANVERVAKKFANARDFLFIGRGSCYPIALEGALKLKEISYIHAEGYPAGELKHGPIALIDEQMPVVVIVQRSNLTDKVLSNLREVESRGGRIIAVTDEADNSTLAKYAEEVISVPFVASVLSPMLLTLPLQLLAYYVAVQNGTDVDLPRNLAKSVTVE
jgi:glucosamine--fructose-6-phosphate aminotransferase (isomerizing)